MKLSWRDIFTSIIVVGGGLIVWSKYYNYNWPLIGSWRNATAVLSLAFLIFYFFTNFDFNNFSVANTLEMILGAIAIVLAVWGITVTSSIAFYYLSLTFGIVWLIDILRHLRHSLMESGHSSSGNTTNIAPLH